MFYMKSDDTDDMFRKAAEEYELNENLAADWNSVHSALEQDKVSVVQEPEEKKRKKYYWLWLFLFIPATLFTTYEAGVFRGSTAHEHAAAGHKKNNNIQQPVLPNTIVENESRKNNSDSILSINKNQNGLNNDAAGNVATGKNYFKQQSTNQSKSQFNPVTNTSITSNKNSNNNIVKEDQSNKDQNDIVNDNKNDVGLNNTEKIQQSATEKKQDAVLNNNIANAQNVIASNSNDSANKIVAANTNAADSNKTIAKTSTGKKQKSDNSIARKSFVYAGLSGLADLSFVKDQKTSKIGLGGGIIAGYHFKNGFSIESGVLLDKKNYYTDGRYFNKDKLNNFLQSSTIIYADGNCNMWEVPVNIKYDFNSKKKYNFFVTAGSSSYFMKKEYYDMQFEKDGTVYQKGYAYYHSANNLFSVVNLGAGVNVQAGKKYFVQVQPYYKVPLSGVGTGKLSLSSGGISLSVMRHF